MKQAMPNKPLAQGMLHYHYYWGLLWPVKSESRPCGLKSILMGESSVWKQGLGDSGLRLAVYSGNRKWKVFMVPKPRLLGINKQLGGLGFTTITRTMACEHNSRSSCSLLWKKSRPRWSWHLRMFCTCMQPPKGITFAEGRAWALLESPHPNLRNWLAVGLAPWIAVGSGPPMPVQSEFCLLGVRGTQKFLEARSTHV